MTAPTYLGVDPGYSGALAFYTPANDALSIYDMPLFKLGKAGGGVKTAVDLIQLAQIIDNEVKHHSVLATVELVGTRPGEAQRSAFNFGFAAGVIHGALAAHFLRIETVTPAKWKRGMACPADKDGARQRASQLLPQHASMWPLKKHDGRAEAALIALWSAGR